MLLWPDAITSEDAAALRRFLARGGRLVAADLSPGAWLGGVVRDPPTWADSPLGADAPAGAPAGDPRRRRRGAGHRGSLHRRPARRCRPWAARRRCWRWWRASAPAGPCCWPTPRRSSTTGSPGGTMRRSRSLSQGREDRWHSWRACMATVARAAGARSRAGSGARSCCSASRARCSCWRADAGSGPAQAAARELAPARAAYAEGLAGVLVRSGPASDAIAPVVEQARGACCAPAPEAATSSCCRLRAPRGSARTRRRRSCMVRRAPRPHSQQHVAWHASTSGGERHDRGLRTRARRGAARRRGAGPDCRPGARRRLRPAATCCSRASPASPRRCSRTRSRRRSALEFRRVQFTPDMLPSDVTGTMTLRGGELAFRPGPVFTNVLLADEINRTPPKTQAALLEAMQERQVTRRRQSPRRCPTRSSSSRRRTRSSTRAPTRCPRRSSTASSPSIDVGYPDAADEAAMLRLAHRGVRAPTLDDVAGGRDARRALRARRHVSTRPTVSRRGRRLRRRARAPTRELPSVALGASPRAAVHLLAAARGRGAARRPRVRDPRRRRRDGRARAAPPPRAAARGRARARHAAGDAVRGRDRGGPGAAMTPDAARRARAARARAAARSSPAGGSSRVLAAALVAAAAVDAVRARRPPRVERTLPAGRRARRRRRRSRVERRAAAGACACARRCRRTSSSSHRRRTASSTGELVGAAPRPPRAAAGRRARDRAARARARGTTAWRGEAEVLVYPDLRRRAPARGRRPPRPAPRRRAAARAARSASARTSSRCATTRPTTTCARSTGARRRGSAAR